MTEDKGNVRMVFFECGEDMLLSTGHEKAMYGTEFLDHSLAVRTDIINIEFNCVSSRFANTMTCESWIESHFDCAYR